MNIFIARILGKYKKYPRIVLRLYSAPIISVFQSRKADMVISKCSVSLMAM